MNNPKRHLVLVTSGSLGDFLMFVCLADACLQSASYSDATIVVSRGAAFLGTFLGEYKNIALAEVSRSPASWLCLPALMRPATFVLMQPTPGRLPRRAKLLFWLLTRMRGSRYVGFEDRGSARWYDTALAYDTAVPYVAALAEAARALGGDFPLVPALALQSDARVLDRLGIEDAYAVLHPRGSSEKRSFRQDDARAVVESLLGSHGKVALTGSRSEEPWLAEVRQGLAENLRERVSVTAGLAGPELAALVSRCALYVGVDTGMTHLACLLGARVLCVAHHGTANWLPFYCPGARVLYKLEEDTEAHEGQDYLRAHARGRLKPFGRVPLAAIQEAIRAA